MKIIVTGDRDWGDEVAVRKQFARLPNGSIVIHGAARGLDTIADKIAAELGFERRPYPVSEEDWRDQGPAAGPIRNSHMLKMEHPDTDGVMIDFGLAFTAVAPTLTGSGTWDMIRKLYHAQILCIAQIAPAPIDYDLLGDPLKRKNRRNRR